MRMHHPEIAINQTLACAVRKLSELCTGALVSGNRFTGRLLKRLLLL
jgi:hypothetical protein